MFRDGLVALLNVDPDFEVVGATATGHEVVDLADQLEPDVVIMDLGLPGLHGAVATREILARHPEIRVLVLTMHDDDASLFGALRAGARGLPTENGVAHRHLSCRPRRFRRRRVLRRGGR